MIAYRISHLSLVFGLMLSLTVSCTSLEKKNVSNSTNSDWSSSDTLQYPNSDWPSSDTLQNQMDELVRLNNHIAKMKLVLADVFRKTEIDSAVFSSCSKVISFGSYKEHLKTLENSVDLELRVRREEYEALKEILRGPR